MASHLIQHMLEKRQAGLEAGAPRAVEIQGDPDLGF
jgi:hypothetical protein